MADSPQADSSGGSSLSCHSDQTQEVADAYADGLDECKHSWHSDTAEAGLAAVQQAEHIAGRPPAAMTPPLLRSQLPSLQAVPEGSESEPEQTVLSPEAQQSASCQVLHPHRQWQRQHEQRQQQDGVAGSRPPGTANAAGLLRSTDSVAPAGGASRESPGQLLLMEKLRAEVCQSAEPQNPFASTPASLQPWSPGPSPLRCVLDASPQAFVPEQLASEGLRSSGKHLLKASAGAW